MSDNDALSAMVFIESLRRKEIIGKGGFTGIFSYNDNTATLNRPAFRNAKAGFRNWWNNGNKWPSIRSTDPLAGTGLTIDSGP